MYSMLLNLLTVLSPMTSDSTNFVWLIPVAAVSLILLVLLVVLGKKRK
jgi:hypothetical protein